MYQQLFALAGDLLRWVEENTPTEVFARMGCRLREAISVEQTLFRILNYPPLAAGRVEDGSIRAAAHEDINLLTVLPASTESGLQIKDLDGAWHPVECEPGNIIINAGDMLQECSGHHYISTTHRVVNPTGGQANKARMSMPLFLHAKPEVYLSEKYPRAKMYLDERIAELGLAGVE